jgi:hypothetical protein
MGKPRQGVGSCSICALSTSRGAPSLSWHRSRRGRRCWSLWPFPLGRAATAFSVTQSSFLGVIHIFQVAWGPVHCGRLPRVLLWPAQPAVGATGGIVTRKLPRTATGATTRLRTHSGASSIFTVVDVSRRSYVSLRTGPSLRHTKSCANNLSQNNEIGSLRRLG